MNSDAAMLRATAVRDWAETPLYREDVREIAMQRLLLIEKLHGLLEKVDTEDRERWPLIVNIALDAGLSEDEMQAELGASPSTIWRWRVGEGAPREGTRRLMKRALLSLVEEKIRCLKEQAPAPATAEGEERRRLPHPKKRVRRGAEKNVALG